MRRLGLTLLVVVLVSLGVLAQQGNAAQAGRWASADDKTAQMMIALERKWAEGVCADNGVVEEILAEDFVGTGTGGERFTKADELKSEKGPHTSRECGLDSAKVRYFGDSVAVIYGSEHALGKDAAHPDAKVCQVWTDTWLKRSGKWQIVASQDNRVPCQ